MPLHFFDPSGSHAPGSPVGAAARRATGMSDRAQAQGGASQDRLLPLIAAERALRAIVLISLGVILASHVHTDWGKTVTDTARHLGFDPSRNGIQRLSGKAHALSPRKLVVYGLIAIAYGVLEAAEGYGLFRRKRWGEYLTIIATSLLFIPEISELIKKPTPLKILALILNVVIVAYLIYRLRRRGG